ncbi:MAG: OmpH family outer membrane protein [Firmicutes bacterium]|jgi:outer membrane protein|nr:OmpH family outer membrane protein [Bacillota bacterium]NLL88544.1 OmpH family outer membrane protein [Bacillota bacterium]
MKKALKYLLPVIVLGVVVFAMALEAEDFRIAVVNMDKVIDESYAGQEANKALLSFIDIKQTEVDLLAEEINRFQEELGEEVTDEQLTQLYAMLADYQEALDQANTEVQTQAQTLRNRLVSEILEVIRQIGEARQYDLIVDSATVTYFTRVNIVDITGEVIRNYDQIKLQPEDN